MYTSRYNLAFKLAGRTHDTLTSTVRRTSSYFFDKKIHSIELTPCSLEPTVVKQHNQIYTLNES